MKSGAAPGGRGDAAEVTVADLTEKVADLTVKEETVNDVNPTYEERPWGSFTVLDDAATHKVKSITVTPGQRLSYQRHSHRSEHWFVISGDATVTLDGVEFLVPPGHYADIPQGVAHRLENKGTRPLVIIEVQHGDYFGEDDIIRLSDDYGRAG